MYAENDGDIYCDRCGAEKAADGLQVIKVIDTDLVPSNWTCGDCNAPLGGTGEPDDSLGLELDVVDELKRLWRKAGCPTPSIVIPTPRAQVTQPLLHDVDLVVSLHTEPAPDAKMELHVLKSREPVIGDGVLVFDFGLGSDQLNEPFCACGHVISQCDGSRKGCGKGKVSKAPSACPECGSQDLVETFDGVYHCINGHETGETEEIPDQEDDSARDPFCCPKCGSYDIGSDTDTDTAFCNECDATWKVWT